jgi:hypothetical protein
MKITPSRDVKVHLIGKRQTSSVFFFFCTSEMRPRLPPLINHFGVRALKTIHKKRRFTPAEKNKEHYHKHGPSAPGGDV